MWGGVLEKYYRAMIACVVSIKSPKVFLLQISKLFCCLLPAMALDHNGNGESKANYPKSQDLAMNFRVTLWLSMMSTIEDNFNFDA